MGKMTSIHKLSPQTPLMHAQQIGFHTQNDDRGTLEREPVWLGGKALGCYTERSRFESASVPPSLQKVVENGHCLVMPLCFCSPLSSKGCGKRTLFSDATYPQKNDKSKMAFTATQLSTKSWRWKQCSERLFTSPSARLSVTTSTSASPPPPTYFLQKTTIWCQTNTSTSTCKPPAPTPKKQQQIHTHTKKNHTHKQKSYTHMNSPHENEQTNKTNTQQPWSQTNNSIQLLVINLFGCKHTV